MRKLKFAVLILALAAAGAQLIQPDRINPPADPAASFEALTKPSPPVAAVIARACRDCHSHQTVWPWYSHISPVSWMITDDVAEGRARLNLSQWSIYSPEMSRVRMRAMCGEVKEGKMPLKPYSLLHSEARLTRADVAALCGIAGM